jgi:hypothetical protein
VAEAYYTFVPKIAPPPPDPEMPRNVSVTAGNGVLLVSFNNPPNTPDSYQARITNTVTGASSTTGFSVNAIRPISFPATNGQQHSVELRSMYEGTDSDWTAPVYATPSAATPTYQAVSNFSALFLNEAISINFTKPTQSDLNDFLLRLGRSSSEQIIILPANVSLPYVISDNIVNGQTYSVRVQARYGGTTPGESAYSPTLTGTPTGGGTGPNLSEMEREYYSRSLPESEIPPGPKYYVDFQNGNDNSSGLLSTSPFRTYARALAAVGNGTILSRGICTEYLSNTNVNGRDITLMALPGYSVVFDGSNIPRMGDDTYYLPPARSGTGMLTLLGSGQVRIFDHEFKNSAYQTIDCKGTVSLYGERLSIHDSEGAGINNEGTGLIELWNSDIYNCENRRTWLESTGYSFDWADGGKGSGETGESRLRYYFVTVDNCGDDNVDFWHTRNALLKWSVLSRAGKKRDVHAWFPNTVYGRNRIIHVGNFLYRAVQNGNGTTGSSIPNFTGTVGTPNGRAWLDSQPTFNDGSVIWKAYSRALPNGNNLKHGGAGSADNGALAEYVLTFDPLRSCLDNNKAYANWKNCTLIRGSGEYTWLIGGPNNRMINSYASHQGSGSFATFTNNQVGGGSFVSTTFPTDFTGMRSRFEAYIKGQTYRSSGALASSNIGWWTT